jgi:hypothetical protein
MVLIALVIGCDDNGGAAEHFFGLDEVQIYNRALSAVEISGLAQR